jgi:hypothetical protein
VNLDSESISRAKKLYNFLTLGRGKWYVTIAWFLGWVLPVIVSALGVSWCGALVDFHPYRLLGRVLGGFVVATLLVAYVRGA